MRKKIFAVLVVAVGVAFAGYNIVQSQNSKNTLSELALANVEALANNESGGNSVTCYSSSKASKGSTYYDCGQCTMMFNSEGTGNSSTCTTK